MGPWQPGKLGMPKEEGRSPAFFITLEWREAQENKIDMLRTRLYFLAKNILSTVIDACPFLSPCLYLAGPRDAEELQGLRRNVRRSRVA